SLSLRANKIALVQRPGDARLMAGMWELPPAKSPDGKELMRLKHSITHSDYRVTVFSRTAAKADVRWVSVSRLGGLALTGLARKILQRAGLLNIKRAALMAHHSRTSKIDART